MTAFTDRSQPPDFIKLLANDIRWAMLQALARSDLQVNELVTLIQQPMNLVSYHLKKMRDDALVTTRRSEADGRDVYYSLDLVRVRELYLEAGHALHPSLTGSLFPRTEASFLSQRVLFVCTHNSARSQIAEGLMRHLSKNQLEVFSAGSHPTVIHPDAIRTLKRLGIDIEQQASKSIDSFAGQSFDYVITVCDKAREVCPTFPGTAHQVHWGFPDPVAIANAQARMQAFDLVALHLTSRIQHFLSTLPTVTNKLKG